MYNAEFPVYGQRPMTIASGSGVDVMTADGRRLLDLYGGHAAALLGYGHAGLIAALKAQAETLFFQTNAVDVAVRQRAHAALVDLAPEGIDRAFLVNSGAEANENALRLAFRHTGRTQVVTVAGAFHGRTAAAGACTQGHAKWYAFPRTPFDVLTVPADDVDALDAAITQDTAAVILEPIQGVAGARPLSHAFLQAARTLTQRRGALLISDEIQCGMGRSGKVFAIEWADVIPDLITTAKGLAGGFPAGAVLAPAHLVDDLGLGALGTTFGGGPMACALIEVIAQALSAPGFLAQVTALGDTIRSTCQVGPIVDIQGRGLLMGLRTRGPARQIRDALLERGIWVGTAADPHILRLMPPLILQTEHVVRLRDALLDLGLSNAEI